MQRISRPRLSIITVYPFEEEPDPNGNIALSYGANYYIEGMSYTDPKDRETRIQCFQAAETLYLHAAAKGNVIALNPTRSTRTQRESASGSIRGRPTRNPELPKRNRGPIHTMSSVLDTGNVSLSEIVWISSRDEGERKPGV